MNLLTWVRREEDFWSLQYEKVELPFVEYGNSESVNVRGWACYFVMTLKCQVQVWSWPFENADT